MPLSYNPPDEQLNLVTSVFSEFCHRNELTILSAAADRYDSWEWSAVQKNDISRFLSLLLTPKPKSRAFINARIVAEAESEEKIARKCSAQLVSLSD